MTISLETPKTIDCLTYSINFKHNKYSGKFNGALVFYLDPKLQYKEIFIEFYEKIPEMRIVKVEGIKAKIDSQGKYSIESKSIV